MYLNRMNEILSKLRALSQTRTIKFALPFFVLVLGGSLYLEQFSQLRYKFGKQKSLVSPEELKKQGIFVKDRSEVTIEAQYEKMKEMDIDNWEQKRIPRPWEEETSQ